MSENKENFVERNSLKWFFFIVAAAIFFRVFNITVFSLWTDEISTLWVSSAPTLSETWQRAAATQGMHPLYFLIQSLLLSMMPVSESALRGFSCASSIISVFLIFWLAKIIFNDEIRPLVAAAIFAIHADSIYYAQEARPYAPAIMFALFSQILFFHLGKGRNLKIYVLYIICTVLAVYMHYTIAALLFFQNLYLLSGFLIRQRSKYLIDLPPLKDWLALQFACAVFMVFSIPHVMALYQSRAAWTWIKDLDFAGAAAMFLSMFDLGIVALMICVSAVFFFCEKIRIKDVLERLELKPSLLLLIWLISPFIFVFFASKILDTPFFDPRYMVFAMPAYYLLLANFLDIFKSDVLRTSFPGVYFILYLGLISVPLYAEDGAFCRRVAHDWKGALLHVRENFRSGDAILLRFGEIKENWMPSSSDKLIKEFVSAPFRTFYWTRRKNEKLPPIFNLTFSWDEEFYSYYDKIFTELCKHRRVWLIGVNPPNTNYQIQAVAKFMQDEFSFNKIWDADFSGLYLALLESNPVIRQQYLVPSFYEEIRQEIKKQKRAKKNNEENSDAILSD